MSKLDTFVTNQNIMIHLEGIDWETFSGKLIYSIVRADEKNWYRIEIIEEASDGKKKND